ncbi:hypothetical protein [Salmonella enterica]|nr:hypothetical protein [Salmonella enterica]MDR4119837.1 hypothetical protein [Salmonella enterica subsp. enterica]
MSQLKQPIFLKKIKKVINTIPGLEEQIFACRNKKRSDNPLLFIDRKDEERILMSRLQSQQKNEELASKLESLFHGNELSSPHSILCFIYWRYTKKIYRLSEDIISDVANTYVDKPRFYVSTSKSIIKALINMHSFEIQLSPIG